MRKFKKGLISVATLAFVVSLSCGVGFAKANVSADGTTDPIASLALETSAKVKVGDSASKSGFSYVLKMNASDYMAMTDEKSAYSDVTFGVLIAPEYYHDIYNLNEKNVFGDEAVYYWEGVENTEGKEELINLTGNLVAWEGDTENVYFRASLIDVLGVDDTDVVNNIALDFRGVGYVKYTLGDETKYVLVDDDGALGETNDYDNDNVVSMAYVAQEEIKANNAILETETDETAIATLTAINSQLQNDYIANVNWKLNAVTESATLNPLTETTIAIPATVKALDNTFYADKYDVAWTFGGNAVTAGATIASPTLSGAYELVATATRKTNADDVQVVYTKTFTVETPKVGGNAISAQGTFTYDANTGLYETKSNSLKQFFVDSVTDGDYVAEAMITTTYKDGGMYMPGIIIGTGAYDNYIVLKGMGGSGRLYITVRTSTGDVYTSTECYVSNNTSGADTVGGTTGYTVARVNGTYYVYNKSGVFVCAIDNTGIYPNGSSTVSYESGQSEEKMFANLATYYTKGNENIVGIYTNAYTANTTMGYSYDVTVTKGTNAASSYAIGNATVNGLTMAGTGSATYVGNGAWKNSDTTTTTRQYYLNTVVRGDTDFVLESNVLVESKQTFGGWTGVSLGLAKTTRSDKTLGDSQTRIDFKINNYDIALGGGTLTIYARRSDGYNMSITVKGFSANVGVVNGTSKMTLVRLGDKLYVYDNTDALVCYLDATGVYGATESNTVTYSVQNQSWYASNIGYSLFTGAPECVAGTYYEKYGDSYGVYHTSLTMTRGTTAAQNKVGA